MQTFALSLQEGGMAWYQKFEKDIALSITTLFFYM